MKKFLSILAVGAMVLLSACTQVGANEEGVRIIQTGAKAGVQAEALTPRRYFNKFNEDIVVFSLAQNIYHYKGANTLVFRDRDGMEMEGDLAVTTAVRAGSSPTLYQRYNKKIDAITMTEVRMALNAAIRDSASKYTSEEIYRTKSRVVIQEALDLPYDPKVPEISVREHFNRQGIEIRAVEWLSSLRIAESVAKAIEDKAAKIQQAEAAKADEVRARAQAAATVATAEGEARAIELRAAALRASPEVIEQIYAQRSAGLCPPRATTCIIGSGSWGLVPQGNKNSYDYSN